MTKMYLMMKFDCEATQHSIKDPDLGERAIRGLQEIMSETGTLGSFVAIPPDIQAHAAIYQEFESQGHEVGLHAHPADQGYEEFLGVYGPEEQAKILLEGMDTFADCMGRKPTVFCAGYGSANDHTFPVLEELGFTHGTVSIPTRDLPQCACVWGSSPLDLHYPHRYHRCLTGDVDFVEMPNTIDPESRMWGGRHPQDLRVELVDAKNHFYTIEKAVRRQLDAGDSVPIKYIKITTHNIFDYSDPANFRRETLLGMLDATRRICDREGLELIPATMGQAAALYRAAVPLPEGGVSLKLDTRGRAR